MPTTTSTPATWQDYVRAIAGPDATQREIADRSGVHFTTISNWLNGRRQPPADTAIAFARAYDVNPVEALVIAGYLTGSEANLHTAIWSDPTAIPTDVLLAEVGRRTQGSAA